MCVCTSDLRGTANFTMLLAEEAHKTFIMLVSTQWDAWACYSLGRRAST